MPLRRPTAPAPADAPPRSAPAPASLSTRGADTDSGAGIFRQAFASAWRIDSSQLELLPALRCTIGVAAPLIVALLLNRAGAGVFVAVGGVSAGFGSFKGAYRSRAATMMWCAAGMGVSVLIGSLAGASHAAAILAAAAWGFAAGMSVAIGPAASFVLVQSAVAVLVSEAYPAEVGGAVNRALLVVAGGMIQTLLVVSVWPLRRFRAERTTIRTIYSSLAEYAARMASAGAEAPEPHTLAQAASAADDPQPFARSAELTMFRALIAEAESIRAALAAVSLTPMRENTALTGAVASVLDAIATAVDEGRSPAPLAREWQTLDTAARARGSDDRMAASLVGRLHRAYRLAAAPLVGRARATDGRRRDPRGERSPIAGQLRDAVMTIQANFSLRSTACRHALRLAAALAATTATYRLSHVPRGYWIPMTTLLVLRPEYRETFVTGTARMIGTLAGSVLAAALVQAFGTHPAGLTMLLVMFVWSGYAVFRGSYTLFTVSITGYIVVLLFLSGVPGPITATYRALDTLAGGTAALAIYRAWPTWESASLGDVLAAVANAFARDADVVLGTFADPRRWDASRLQQAVAEARLARSNAEAAVERALAEPPRRGFDARTARRVLTALRYYAVAALALHARLAERPPTPRPELESVRRDLVGALDAIAEQLRGAARASAVSALRPPTAFASADVDSELADEIGLMVDAADEVAAILDAAGGGHG